MNPHTAYSDVGGTVQLFCYLEVIEKFYLLICYLCTHTTVVLRRRIILLLLILQNISDIHRKAFWVPVLRQILWHKAKFTGRESRTSVILNIWWRYATRFDLLYVFVLFVLLHG